MCFELNLPGPSRDHRWLWASLQAACAAIAMLQAAWCALLQPLPLPLFATAGGAWDHTGDDSWGEAVPEHRDASGAAADTRVPAQLCWSVALAPLLALQGCVFGSAAFRSVAARRAWARAAAAHLRPPTAAFAGDNATSPGNADGAPPSPTHPLRRRDRRRRRQWSLLSAAAAIPRRLAPLAGPLADAGFGVAAALLPGIRLMGILYLVNVLLHLLCRSRRPAAWHNALRQGALTAELLVWALQRLANDVYRGATGGGSLSLAQVRAAVVAAASAGAAPPALFLFFSSHKLTHTQGVTSYRRQTILGSSGTRAIAGSQELSLPSPTPPTQVNPLIPSPAQTLPGHWHITCRQGPGRR